MNLQEAKQELARLMQVTPKDFKDALSIIESINECKSVIKVLENE